MTAQDELYNLGCVYISLRDTKVTELRLTSVHVQLIIIPTYMYVL